MTSMRSLDEFANISRWRKYAFEGDIFSGCTNSEIYHSLADGRSPLDRQTQPTLPGFDNVCRDSSKAGDTKEKKLKTSEEKGSF